jgi:tRNA(fMet)-specific endonuclease VapC
MIPMRRLSKKHSMILDGLKRMTDRANGIVLDTSIIIPHLHGNITAIASAVLAGIPLFLPLVVLGELYKGALSSARPEHNRLLVDKFLLFAALLHPDSATADVYAKISVQLRRKGRPLPENDVWITAVAVECNMPLATRDKHF